MQELSRFFRIPLEHIGYARALVEAYEGVALLCSQDSNRGEVELLYASPCAQEAEEIVRTVARETGWMEIPRPMDWKE